jgi:hypothetical protein
MRILFMSGYTERALYRRGRGAYHHPFYGLA